MRTTLRPDDQTKIELAPLCGDMLVFLPFQNKGFRVRGVPIPKELHFFMPLGLTCIGSLEKYVSLCGEMLILVLANQK